MPFELEKTYSRLWSINKGNIMVVTDLHGDLNTYQHCRDRFFELHAEGKADCLIFAGDLIHANSENDHDGSLDIVLNVQEMQRLHGNAIIYLCGNHELPHIYRFGLSKGKREYTPSFEATLSKSGKRSEALTLFSSLPFFVRTKAGVSITHAGAFPASELKNAKALFNWDHDEQLIKAKEKLAEMDIEGMRRAYAKLSQAKSYDELVRHYLAVTGRDDPRYDDLLVGLFATSNPGYQQLHSALFTKCELENGESAYSLALVHLLSELSIGYASQKMLVTGHITVQNGYEIVADHHLRLASGCHATPRETSKYLLFNSGRQIDDMEALRACLYSVW